MFEKIFVNKIGTPPKIALASAILVVNAFVWGFYSFYFLNLLTDNERLSLEQIFAVRGLNFFGIVVAALLGVFLVYRLGKRVTFLRYWMQAGIPLSLIPMVVDIQGFFASAVFFSMIGVYFGLGMPIALAYFAASTETDGRSRLGGVLFFVSFFGVFGLGALRITSIELNAILLAVWQAIGLGLTYVFKPRERPIFEKDHVSYSYILRNKSFLFYLIPWAMFVSINFLGLPLVNKIFPDLFQYIETMGTVLAGILALFLGFLVDSIGRKRVAVFGFVLLGLAYASLGLFQGNILGWSFFALADGFAWGIFCVVFVMTIWGDLSQGKSSEKYYAIGFMPFLFSFFMQLVAPYVSLDVPSIAVFSFASMFLFVAVLPLAYVPETLNLKDREFKKYVGNAMQAKLKFKPES